MPSFGDMPANWQVSQLFVPEGYVDLPKILPPPLNPDLDRVRIFAVDTHGIATLVYQSDTGFTARMLRDNIFTAYNGTNSIIAKGQPVCANGVASSDVVNLALAHADTAQGEAIGVAAQTFQPNSYGHVMTAGRISDVDTTAYSSQVPLWLSTTPGTLTATEPSPPARVQQVAAVISPGSTAGAIRVNIVPPLEVGLAGGLAYLDSAGHVSNTQLGDTAGGVYGDGSDGDITISSGTTTLSRDMFYRNLTVVAGATLKPNGYRIYVQRTLTNNGIIDRKGINGASSVGGAALPAGSLGAGGAGGNGGSPSVAGGAGGAVTALPGTVGTAGAGGVASKAAGMAGSVTTLGATYGSVRSVPGSVLGVFIGAGGSGTLGGGPGGGGGSGSITQIGGGGGSGGGPMIIAARTIVNAGTITTAGGNGGNANGTAAGAGGGGGGGPLLVTYSTLTNTGTLTAAGGAAGTTGSTAGAGAAGAVVLVAN